MNLALPTAFLLSSALLVKRTNAHGVEVRQCVSADGTSINFYVEHWHGPLSSPAQAGTMTIQEGSTQVTKIPDGVLNNYDDTRTDQDWDCLGGVGAIPAVVTTCNNPQNNWVYYRYPLQCGAPVTYTLLSGNTAVLTSGCGNTLYPASFTSTFQDTSAPVIKIDGQIIPSDITVTADTIASTSASVSFQVTADDCDPSPNVQISDDTGANNYPTPTSFISGDILSGTFPIGDTQVTVS